MELQGKNLRLKMLSNCYRYNASSSHLIKAFLRPNTSIHSNYGFDSRGVTDNRITISPNDFTIPDDTPIDDSHLKGFIHNNELIYDDYHLNCNGAELFTKELANQIGQTLQGE